MKAQALTLSIGVLAAAALTACGGGGAAAPQVASYSAACGDGTAQTSTVSAAAAAAQCPSTINSVIAAATYAVGSEELAAYNRLNSERVACGFGSLAQSAQLDASAKNHNDWKLKNNTVSHNEVAGTPSFTGLTPIARDAAAGFAALDANEGMFDQTGGTGAITGLGDGAVRAQLSGPYHAFGAISAWRSVGISVESITSLGLPVGGGLNAAVTLDYAVPTGGSYQQQDPSSVLTYPCQASTGVNYRLTNESPSPVPGRNLVTTPLGPAVLVMLRQGRVLTITSATMTNLTTGLPVTLRTPVTSANDPANFFSAFGAYMGYIIPDAPIAQNTAHQVTINGTNNGTAFSRTFTFTSGTGG